MPVTSTMRSMPLLQLLLILQGASAFTAFPSTTRQSGHPNLVTTLSPSLSSRLYYIQEPAEETANEKDVFRIGDEKGETEQVTKPQAAALFSTGASENPDHKLALDELLDRQLNSSNDAAELVFLFVGKYHAEQFEEIVEYAQMKLEDNAKPNNKKKGVEVVAMLGFGVIGGGTELDDSKAPAMTILSGSLPKNSRAIVFQYEEGIDDDLPEDVLSQVEKYCADSETPHERPPSFMVFSDPFAPLDDLFARLDQPRHPSLKSARPVVAGGVTVPPGQQRVPSVARNGHLLPAGSFVGVAFTGNVGLSTVVAQGCRPVGPTFVITEASNKVLTGLSGKSAIDQLEQVAKDADEQDKELIQNGEVVCGIGSTNSAMVQSTNHDGGDELDIENMRMYEEEEGASDFLIRQMMGFRPKSGSIVVAAGGLKEGNTFRFHVRAAKSAEEDMALMIQRAKTERLFAGSSALIKTSTSPGVLSPRKGKPMAAFQLSCVARGAGFYGSPNVDLKKVEGLFEEGENGETLPPIAGFFANGEIGPVGIQMAEMAAMDAEKSDRTTSNTFLHGFTTVVAMLCDYSGTEESQPTEAISVEGILAATDDAWA